MSQRILNLCSIALKGRSNSAQGKRSDALGELASPIQALKGRHNSTYAEHQAIVRRALRNSAGGRTWLRW